MQYSLMKKQLLITIFTILLLINFSGCLDSSENNNNGSNNDESHDFSFEISGSSTKNLKDYRGKVVLLDLWATWCTPCGYQMLELYDLYNTYDRDEVEVISINIDDREDFDDIKSFKDNFGEYGYDLSWIFGKEDEDLDKYMNEGAIPTICIFDQEVNLYYRNPGFMYFDEIPSNWPDTEPEPTLLVDIIEELL